MTDGETNASLRKGDEVAIDHPAARRRAAGRPARGRAVAPRQAGYHGEGPGRQEGRYHGKEREEIAGTRKKAETQGK